MAMIVDAIWAKYTIATARLQPLTSAVMGALIYVINAILVISYVSNPWNIIPVALGAFVGTYFVVNKHKKESELE